MTLWPSAFIKAFWDAYTTAAKIYEKDPQTLSEVIQIVEKLDATQQLTAMLTPCMVSMMSNDDRCFVCRWMGHFGHHCPNAQCYRIWPLCIRLPQQDSFLRNTMWPWQVSFKAIIFPHPQGQITLHPLWAQTWETFQMITITLSFPVQQEQQQFQKAHIMLLIKPPQWLTLPFAWWMSHQHSCQDTPHRHSCSPSHTCHFSLQHHLATIPRSTANLTPATLTTWHREHSWWGKPSHTQDHEPPHTSHHSKIVISQDSPSDSSSDSEDNSDSLNY